MTVLRISATLQLPRRFRLIWVLLLPVIAAISTPVFSQPKIVHIQPDAMAPGMSIAAELFAPASSIGAFGSDGIYLPQDKIVLVNPLDSLRIVFGPVCVSWNGRLLQVPIMTPPTATPGEVQFRIVSGNRKSDTVSILIASQIPQIDVNGSGILGDGTIGSLTNRNTMVVDVLKIVGNDPLSRGLFQFSLADPDTSLAGNPRYLPITILVRDSVYILNANVSVSSLGIDGGPGGGGGGHGFQGIGGKGFTGGGSDSADIGGNTGSATNPTDSNGGGAITGVRGGATVDFNSAINDQGGGGGTGAWYGASGVFSSGNDTSQAGGYGGGSAGGETVGEVYGGGGGGFASAGLDGAGIGSNGGQINGGRFLLPLQGGSGGGAGNAVQGSDSTAGSGGGGGGAISIVAFGHMNIQNSFITANGSGGTSGVNPHEAGGGGGSGGSIFLSARTGFSIANTIFSAAGGSGGDGGDSVTASARGGDGGLGRIVTAGSIDPAVSITGVRSSVPTVTISTSRLSGATAIISGTAGSATDLEDSIRIYYRDHHSPWRWKDTVRYTKNNQLLWSAELPLNHDSLLFVTVYEKVHAPHTGIADYEPEWLTSHLSSAVIPTVPSTHLVLQSDTINFGSIYFTDCDSAAVLLTNLGEAFLTVNSVTTTNNKFSVVKYPSTVGLYASDSLVLKFCPGSEGCDTATATITTANDGIHTIVLIGCGIARDERLTVTPPFIDFGRLPLDSCKTLTLTVRSSGKDTAQFSPQNFALPPFTIVSPTSDTAIAPGKSIEVKVRYCPADSGAVHATFILDDRRDSLVTWGIGTIKILHTPAVLSGSFLCPHDCDSIRILISSEGNDSIVITGLTNGALLSPAGPLIMPPHTDTDIVVQYCALGFPDSSLTVKFITNARSADKIDSSIIHYHLFELAASLSGKLSFGPICISDADSSTITIRRNGNEPLSIDSVWLAHGLSFHFLTPPSKATDSLTTTIIFNTTHTGTSNDTLLVHISAGSCDSLLQIPLSGVATSGGLVFSSLSHDFGSIDTGACATDSILVSLPCGSPISLQIPALTAPFTLVSPSNGILDLASGESKAIVIQYCPLEGNHDSLSFVLGGGSDTMLTLLGSGQVQPAAVIHYFLPAIQVAPGTISYEIGIDSLFDATGIDTVSGILSFDPLVIKPLSLRSAQNSWSVIQFVEITPGTCEFKLAGSATLANGAIADLSAVALYASSATTSVQLSELSSIKNASASSNIGSITVITCSNLPGNVGIAGPYSFNGLRANPVTSLLNFSVTLGNDGPLHIKIFDVMGGVAYEQNTVQLRGDHLFSIDVSSFSSGSYRLQLDSWGWIAGSSFIIQH